jgi:hypothetical protein
MREPHSLSGEAMFLRNFRSQRMEPGFGAPSFGREVYFLHQSLRRSPIRTVIAHPRKATYKRNQQ